MPKPAPDQVIRHEIVLGRSEKEALDAFVAGNTVNAYAKTAVSLLGDAAAISALIAVLEWTGIIDLTGLAKKLGGYGKEWMDALLAGLFASFEEAIAAYQKRLEDLYPKCFPGGEPCFDIPDEFNPFVNGDALSPAEKAYAASIIYRQQMGFRGYGYGETPPDYSIDPTHRGYGGA